MASGLGREIFICAALSWVIGALKVWIGISVWRILQQFNHNSSIDKRLSVYCFFKRQLPLWHFFIKCYHPQSKCLIFNSLKCQFRDYQFHDCESFISILMACAVLVFRESWRTLENNCITQNALLIQQSRVNLRGPFHRLMLLHGGWFFFHLLIDFYCGIESSSIKQSIFNATDSRWHFNSWFCTEKH